MKSLFQTYTTYHRRLGIYRVSFYENRRLASRKAVLNIVGDIGDPKDGKGYDGYLYTAFFKELDRAINRWISQNSKS